MWFHLNGKSEKNRICDTTHDHSHNIKEMVFFRKRKLFQLCVPKREWRVKSNEHFFLWFFHSALFVLENIKKLFIRGVVRVTIFCGHLNDKYTNTSTALLLTCLTHAYIHNHDLRKTGKKTHTQQCECAKKKFRWSIFRLCICLSTQTSIPIEWRMEWNGKSHWSQLFHFLSFSLSLSPRSSKAKNYLPMCTIETTTLNRSKMNRTFWPI